MGDNMTDKTTDEKDPAKLLTALKAERDARKQAEDKLKTSEAALSAANAKLAEAATLANPNAAGVAKLVTDSAKALAAKETASLQQRVAELESSLAESKKSGEALLGQLASRTISEEVREAARTAHVRPEAINDVLTFAAADLKVVDGKVQTQDGRDVAAWLEDRKASSPYLWPTARGAGARGGNHEGGSVFTGNNPFAPETFNLTEQSRLVQSQPELAKRLQAQVQ